MYDLLFGLVPSSTNYTKIPVESVNIKDRQKDTAEYNPSVVSYFDLMCYFNWAIWAHLKKFL